MLKFWLIGNKKREEIILPFLYPSSPFPGSHSSVSIFSPQHHHSPIMVPTPAHLGYHKFSPLALILASLLTIICGCSCVFLDLSGRVWSKKFWLIGNKKREL